MAITIETIGESRYAPAAGAAINLYSTGVAGGSHLTLGQLAIAVSAHAAAAYESESVLKMNTMTAGSVKLNEGSKWLEKIAAGTANWTEAKAYLTGTLDIEASTLPADISTYARRMAAVAAVKAKIDALAQQQQRDMIDLQTLVNRRDVAYSTSSNIVRSLGTSQQNDSANLR